MTKIAIITGSTRPGRVNRGVAEWVLETASQRSDAEFELVLKTPREEVALTLDGQVGMPLEYDDRVAVRKSRTGFRLIQAHTRNYFDVLRNKLKWGR